MLCGKISTKMKSIWLFLSLSFLVSLIFCKDDHSSSKATMTTEVLPFNDKRRTYTENLLLIGMQVRGTSFRLRKIIRKTLLRLKCFQRDQVKLMFVMATPPEPHQHILPSILEEIETYDDILFFDDIIDGWEQVGLKHVRFLQYAAQTDYLFSMKLDDDAYIFLESLIGYLEKLVLEGKSEDFYYMGKINRRAEPKRSPESKYYISIKEYHRPVYPPFVYGYGSVYSNSLIKELFSKKVTDYSLFMEDIMVALWIEKYSKLKDAKKVHFINFEHYGIEMKRYRLGEVRKLPDAFYSLVHHVNERQLYCLYLCDVEKLPFTEKYKCIDNFNA